MAKANTPSNQQNKTIITSVSEFLDAIKAIKDNNKENNGDNI